MFGCLKSSKVYKVYFLKALNLVWNTDFLKEYYLFNLFILIWDADYVYSFLRKIQILVYPSYV